MLGGEREPDLPLALDADLEPTLAGALPCLGSGDALRAVLVAGQLLELAQLRDVRARSSGTARLYGVATGSTKSSETRSRAPALSPRIHTVVRRRRTSSAMRAHSCVRA